MFGDFSSLLYFFFLFCYLLLRFVRCVYAKRIKRIRACENSHGKNFFQQKLLSVLNYKKKKKKQLFAISIIFNSNFQFINTFLRISIIARFDLIKKSISIFDELYSSKFSRRRRFLLSEGRRKITKFRGNDSSV